LIDPLKVLSIDFFVPNMLFMDDGSWLDSTRNTLCYCDLSISVEDIDDICEESVFHA
jgi:hypothetical protein